MSNHEEKIIDNLENNREEYLAEIREQLRAKGINFDFTDDFLVKFLRSRMYNVMETFKVIETYVNNFKKYPELFDGIQHARNAFEDGFFEILEDHNKTGEAVAIMRPGTWNPSTTTFASVCSSTIYGWEMAEMDEKTQKCGAIEIIDVGNLKLSQFIRIGISEVRLMASMTDSSLPIRWRKIIVCHQNYMTDIIFAMAKPFLSKELKERVVFVGTDMTKLHNIVSPEILPERYGGTSIKSNPKEFYARLVNFEPELKKLWAMFVSPKK